MTEVHDAPSRTKPTAASRRHGHGATPTWSSSWPWPSSPPCRSSSTDFVRQARRSHRRRRIILGVAVVKACLVGLDLHAPEMATGASCTS